MHDLRQSPGSTTQELPTARMADHDELYAYVVLGLYDAWATFIYLFIYVEKYYIRTIHKQKTSNI